MQKVKSADRREELVAQAATVDGALREDAARQKKRKFEQGLKVRPVLCMTAPLWMCRHELVREAAEAAGHCWNIWTSWRCSGLRCCRELRSSLHELHGLNPHQPT